MTIKVKPYLPNYNKNETFKGIEGAIRFKVAVRGMHQYIIDHSGKIDPNKEAKGWRENNLRLRFSRENPQARKAVLADYKRFHIRFSTNYKRQFGTNVGSTEGIKDVIAAVSPEKRAAQRSIRCMQKRRYFASLGEGPVRTKSLRSGAPSGFERGAPRFAGGIGPEGRVSPFPQ